jgi:serine/threonine protein phosphatase 1
MKGPADEFSNGTYTWDRTLWETALKLQLYNPPPPEEYPPKYSLYNEIYIGHTPTIFYNISTPFKALNIWNIDTGAGFDGRLTAMDIDSGLYWQSDAVPELYPGVIGRSR